MNPITDTDWDHFFRVLDKIVNREVPIAEKQMEAILKAESNNAGTNLEEFLAWFGGEIDEDDEEATVTEPK